MTLFIIIAIFIAFVIAIVATDKNQGNYEDRQKILARKLFGSKEPETDVNQMIDDLHNEARRIQAMIQADIVGDITTSSAIKSETYHGPLPEKRDDGGWLSIYDNLRILKIAGINYREGISRYVGRVNCALVPEPDNEYDPDAIKIVAEDRHHIGYISSGQTEMVCWLTANEFPYKCTAIIEEHEDEDDGHHFFTGYVYIKRLD